MTEKSKNIYQRIHEAMGVVTYIAKEDKKVNNQYTFVSHDAVTAKCRAALHDAGVITFIKTMNRVNNGNRVEIDIVFTFQNVDNKDDFLDVPSSGFGIDQQDKGIGKAMSYAVKYAYLKTLGLETGDDPEKDNIEHKEEVQKINDVQLTTLQNMMMEVQADETAFLKYYGIEKLEDLPSASFLNAKSGLEKKRAQQLLEKHNDTDTEILAAG